MLLIEFFDENCIENIACALQYVPEQVVLIGHSTGRLARARDAYRALCLRRGLDIEFTCRSVDPSDLSAIVTLLATVVESSEQCVLELTGGGDLYLVAAGVIAHRYQHRVRLSRMNLREGKIARMLPDGGVSADMHVALTVEENICIYGGKLSGEQPDARDWKPDEDFCEDVGKLWSLCRRMSDWNQRISQLGRIQAHFAEPVVERASIEDCLPLLEALAKEGLIRALSVTDSTLTFTYKNEQVRRALSKAGQVLELWLAVNMQGMRDENGPVFDDIRVGALLDWDGMTAPEGAADVGNEIDVLAMKGPLPLFISCKNGKVETEELYKLSQVADRFGGAYASKALVVRKLEGSGKAISHLAARAKDMGIALLELERLGEEQVLKIIKERNLWKRTI